MEKQIIKSLTKNFESYANKTENGIEFWFARDLQNLLGYTDWRNFLKVISKAKTACEISGNKVNDHFVDANKTIKMPKNAEKTVLDIILTRYACYLTAQNGDSSKEEVAFAQTYFAVQTRRFEIIEKKLQEFERLQARQKLTETEKTLSGVIFQQTGSDKNFGLIRSKGDKALFGYTTQEIKNRLGVPDNRALADFQPTIILKAKDFATEITIFNTKEKGLNTEQHISEEHITNNRSVRKTLIERGIYPEKLPAEEDIKKVGRKLKSEEKKSLKNLDKDKIDK
ncbi:DNA damage-inducible protein D [Patescibacteria group bacterium]|nr:DNA damage-inducible protein D [Patescibacteria group bacterium]MBU4455600.1 DNA damage-inducible protein D [Patescibacteria group bacterium]MCG2690502.1 DNA damage-inducible protein D [Candidatus Parcubacteria bacterium]